MRYWKSLLTATVLAASGAANTQAAELIVLTGMGSFSGVRDVAAGFEKATGHKVTVSFETGRRSTRSSIPMRRPTFLPAGPNRSRI